MFLMCSRDCPYREGLCLKCFISVLEGEWCLSKGYPSSANSWRKMIVAAREKKPLCDFLDSLIFLDYRVSWSQFKLCWLEQYSRCVLVYLTILIILPITRYFRAAANYTLWGTVTTVSSIKFHRKNFLCAQLGWSKAESIKIFMLTP